MNLKPGMFVAELDRPWLETPFSIQGFVVRDDEDVLYVSKYVDAVMVDVDYRGSDIFLPGRVEKGTRDYGGTLPLKAEFEQAKTTFESATSTLERLLTTLSSNQEVNISVVRETVTPLIDTVFRNKEALAVLIRLKKAGEYRYQHGISMAVWATLLGRHLGFCRDELEILAVGCAMCDVGMTQLSPDLLNQSCELDPNQQKVIRAHPHLGAEIVKENGGDVDLEILSIIENHHERHDGSGYPRGVTGSSIPLFARIAGLADSYDAMISERPYAPRRTSFEAAQELIDGGDVLFQRALIEQFVQAIGLFPVGSTVELNTGEIAVVSCQNEARRLKPEVVIIIGADQKPMAEYELVDLSRCSLTGPDARWIVRELQPESCGVSSEDLFL